MKEIVNRLHENRQVELAKSILESNGYKVTKKSKILSETKRLKESSIDESFHELFEKYSESISSMLENYGGVEKYKLERDGTEDIDFACEILGGDYDNIYILDENYEEASRYFSSYWSELEKEELKEVRKSWGHNILYSTSKGEYLYQSMYGFVTIYKKL